MTKEELFTKISNRKNFKDYPNSRLIKFRHKKGTLTEETYEKLFDFFGYTKKQSWIKKPKTQ